MFVRPLRANPRTVKKRKIRSIRSIRSDPTMRAADAPVRWLDSGDVLDGGFVLPGFSIPVARLFARLALM
jgi:hypothetical protein